MLEPLFRCNLACAGCGKDSVSGAHPEGGTDAGRVLQGGGGVRRADGERSPAASRCCIRRCRRLCRAGCAQEVCLHVHECAAAEGEAALFKPSKYLSFSVHVDGQREHHDFSVCREGGYDIAMEGIRAAVARGVPRDDKYDVVRWRRSEQRPRLLRRSDGSGRREHDGSPGYTYDKAPDQNHFLGRARSRRLFRAILSNRKQDAGSSIRHRCSRSS